MLFNSVINSFFLNYTTDFLLSVLSIASVLSLTSQTFFFFQLDKKEQYSLDNRS